MAAGLGTRLQPLTDHLPKPMMPVANRPVIEHLFRRIAAAGFDAAVVNLHYHADSIRSYFKDGSSLHLPIAYSYEAELLGTAGGTKNCEAFLREGGDVFCVTSADGLHGVDLRALVERHHATGAKATLGVKRTDHPERYGVVVVDDDGSVVAFQEKPPPGAAKSDLVNLGIYCFDADVLDRIPAGTFYDFGKQLLPRMVADGVAMTTYETEAFWSDVGSVDELVHANLAALEGEIDLELPGRSLGEGIVADDDVWIDETAEVTGPVLIGRDAMIAANCRVTGPAVIGPGCRLGGGSAVRHAVLLPGAALPAEGLCAGGLLGEANWLADAWRRWPAAGRTVSQP